MGIVFYDLSTKQKKMVNTRWALQDLKKYLTEDDFNKFVEDTILPLISNSNDKNKGDKNERKDRSY